MKKLMSLVMILVLVLSISACGFGELKRLELSNTDMSLTVGDSKTINVYADPENAEVKKLTWSTSNSDIASVENGTVKALGEGNAVITVEAENGVSVSCNVEVKAKDITGITLNKASTSVKKGSTIQLEAKVTPVDAPTGNLKWTSSDDSIATVNSSGYVTGVKAGVVNIVCAATNGVEGSCTVTVEETAKKKSASSKSTTVVNNYYGYGHYHPDYVYSEYDFVFPDSSTRQLSETEIALTLNAMSGYSPSGSYAQDAINEIYARNGYVFNTPEIRAYYESQPWYYPDSSFTTGDFSSVEKYNIGLLENF
ncbi:MAG: Ig-like domain-containing protein [Ruminococcus sp.]|nr:Ig-like domain-containing protein [Ruminococcus sp.]